MMRAAIALFALSALAFWGSGCGDPAARWETGGIYSVSDGGEFGVVKILAIDPEAVNVRVYREKFPSRPRSVDPDGLSLGAIDDPQGFGIGHLPLARRDFALLFPVHLTTREVTEEELEGYRYWKESGGGVFDLGAAAAAGAAEAQAPRDVQP